MPKLDLYKEDGLALSWEKKQEAVRRLRNGEAPAIEDTEDKFVSRAVTTAEVVELDAALNRSIHSEDFTETEVEDEPTWEEWEKQNTGKITAVKKIEPDGRDVPDAVTERMRKFQEEMAAFANQDWMKKNSANNFGEEEKQEEEPKPKKKAAKGKSKKGTTKKTKKAGTKTKKKKKSEKSATASSDDEGKVVGPKEEESEESKPAPANDEIDLDAIKNISLEVAKDNDESSSKLERSMQDIMHEPEHPKYGGSFREGSANNSSSFSTKPVDVRADHESAFDLTWEEKQRAIKLRRETSKTKTFVPPPKKGVASSSDSDRQIAPEDLKFDDEKKKAWAQGDIVEREKKLEDHESGFGLDWRQKEELITHRRLAE